MDRKDLQVNSFQGDFGKLGGHRSINSGAQPGTPRGFPPNSPFICPILDILGIEVPWPLVGLSAGHAGIDERGDQKLCYPRKDKVGFGMEIEKKQTLSDKAHFPRYSSRWIGALNGTEDPLSLLNRRLMMVS
jgi:hypothetical protein